MSKQLFYMVIWRSRFICSNLRVEYKEENSQGELLYLVLILRLTTKRQLSNLLNSELELSRNLTLYCFLKPTGED
jgi:hypothetical protein